MGTVADPEGVQPVDYVPIKAGAASSLTASAECALQEVLVHTRFERQLAVGHWLLAAAPDIKEARKEWAVDGIALLRCGGIFSAIRVPAEVVHAAAGTEELHQVNAYLSAALMGGPVFVDVASSGTTSSYRRAPVAKTCGSPGWCRKRSVLGPAVSSASRNRMRPPRPRPARTGACRWTAPASSASRRRSPRW